MITRTHISAATACFGIAVVSSGLYRFLMQPDGAKALWFGAVVGGAAVLAAFLQRTRGAALGDAIAVVAGLLVGGWFCFENFVQAKHEPRMYAMIALALVLLTILAIHHARRAVVQGGAEAAR